MRHLFLCCCCLAAGMVNADDTQPLPLPNWRGDVLVIGRDETGAPLRALVDPAAFEDSDGSLRVLALVETGSHQAEYAAILARLDDALTKEPRSSLPLKLAIICVSPEMVPGDEPRSSLLHFPPQGEAYNTPGERTAAAIWRFAAWFAPDAIVELHSDQEPEYQAFLSGQGDATWQAGSLAWAIKHKSLPGFASTAGIRLPHRLFVQHSFALSNAEEGWSGIQEVGPTLLFKQHSPLFLEVQKRLAREPHVVVDQLLKIYGEELKSVMYQPALAVMCRQRWAVAQNNAAELSRVANILEPYLNKTQVALPADASGSVFAGHLVFADWARRTQDPRAHALVVATANLAFDAQGLPQAAMPMHHEMSDAVFMSCPILTSAAELTGDAKYLEMAGRHLRFMRKHCRREDGLYRHSPLCEAAWGRGNGFPALGLALALTDLETIATQPHSEQFQQAASELKAEMLANFQEQLTALLPYQDTTGMWQQVIDEPMSYREMTATCMLGFALERGLDRGWLTGEAFQTAVDRAWHAALIRTSEQGELLDVCTGTGKQKSLEDYLNRTATTGRDERGGAMLLMFATERALTP